MILHLLEDDKNIVNRTIFMYEKLAPKNNEYWVEDQGEHVLAFIEESKYVKRLKFDSLIDKIECFKYRAIIFHALSFPKISFLSKLTKLSGLKLIWILWGADLYSHLHLKGYKLLNYEPSMLDINERILFYGGLKGFMLLQIKKVMKKRKCVLSNFEQAISKLDIVCAYDEDFSLLKKYFLNVSSKCLFYNYYPIEISLGEKLINRQVTENNILIGNSNAPTNNHYSAFQIIYNNKNISSKIIVPLSYGGSKGYRKFIIDKGKKMFGDKFTPLINFLPINDYYELLLTCGILIMPHLRQQAVGNIVIVLYLGAKVYLYEENSLYSFFNKIGVTVFSINKITNSPEEFSLLDQSTILRNRKIIEKYFSTNATEKYIDILIKTINQE